MSPSWPCEDGASWHGPSARARKRARQARWSAGPAVAVQSCKAMALAHGYGDEQKADVILTLKPLEGPPLPPLLLHSYALRQSEFFEARLSERWASEGGAKPLEITLDKCGDANTYVRCIQLLYVPDRVKHNSFANVQDALGILEVAAELLFHNCVSACMRYLEAVPWTAENEAAVKACVSNLHLQASPDLAARMRIFDSYSISRPVDVMKDVLGELLSLVTNGAPSKARDITERVLLANVQPCSSSAFAAVNEVSLFNVLHGNLEQLKIQLRKFVNFFSWNAHQVTIACSALRWLFDELFALQIADVAVQMLSEEQELAQLMVSRIYQNPFTETLFHILVSILQALQRGEVLSPRPVRLALITTWLPVVAKLGNDGGLDNFGKDTVTAQLHTSLEDGLGAVVETLPMADQEMIFKIWIAVCLKCRKAWPDLSEAFDSWCSKLRLAQRESEVHMIQEASAKSSEANCASVVRRDHETDNNVDLHDGGNL
ncbi:hypothetical protein CY35_05G075300 [Sphagnum magellanicum]|nr:hypothetical protein CY35_05G075300 [Sphagnum magellanicum]